MKKLFPLFILLFISCSSNEYHEPVVINSNLYCGTISFNSNSKIVGNWNYIGHYENLTLFNSNCPGVEKMEINTEGFALITNCNSQININLVPLSDDFLTEKYFFGDEFMERTFTFENSYQTMHMKYVQNNIQYDYVYHRI